MGYTGKQVIHPDQIEIVQDSFVPSTERVNWARGLLEAFEEHQRDGKVFSILPSCVLTVGLSFVLFSISGSLCFPKSDDRYADYAPGTEHYRYHEQH